MIEVLHIAAVLIVAVAMSLSLAHTLELPGKLRLDRQAYIAVQEIYYPGFTYGGLSEILAIIVTAGLLLVTPVGVAFGWTLAALLLLVAMHAVYWLVTHPVNAFWLEDRKLGGFGRRFFSLNSRHGDANEPYRGDQWRRMRDRWEYSHVARAILAGLALIAITAAVAA